eukprot:TRINITY_DN3318_c0_g1_i2.p1 TRINITY_DN3318_c0_g1~~TRINITY_DN3318_c0_g1_i2.p1  ORF type:complete len:477 (-),score=128.81 TRINITY_DN3318_c0_g1_i2:27-1457(-)
MTKEAEAVMRKRKEGTTPLASSTGSSSGGSDAEKIDALKKGSPALGPRRASFLGSLTPPLSPSLLARRFSVAATEPRGLFFWFMLAFIFVVTYIVWAAFNPPINTGTTPYSLPPLLRQHMEKGTYIPIYVNTPSKVFVRQEGPHDGQAVLIINGSPSSSFSFRRVIELLAKDNVRAIGVDLPGLGLSDKSSASYTWDYLASTITAVVESLQLSGVHLVLQDIAGPIGVEFAATHSYKVKSITFLNAPMDLEKSVRPLIQRLYVTPYIGNAVFRASTHSFAGPLMWAWARLGDSSVLTLDEHKSYQYLATHLDGGAAYHKIVNSYQLGERASSRVAGFLKTLNATGIPMQMIWATKDAPADSAHQASYLDRSVSLRYINYVDSRLLMQEDAPSDLASRISAFVREVEPITPKAHTHDHDHHHHDHDHDHHDHDHHHHGHGHDHHHHHHGHDHDHDHGHGHGHFHGHDHDYGLGNHQH